MTVEFCSNYEYIISYGMKSVASFAMTVTVKLVPAIVSYRKVWQ